MAERTLVHRQAPMEYFREQLEKAMGHQKVATSAFVEYYLVNLLTTALRAGRLIPRDPAYKETPLALVYLRALSSAGYVRLRLLRSLGDVSLFVTGFFADSFHRQRVGLRYYRRLGEFAYGRLGQEGQATGFGTTVFSELSDRFMVFADLFQEVSESTRLCSSRSVLRLYERWVQTRSRRAASLLASQGITPVEPGGLSPN